MSVKFEIAEHVADPSQGTVSDLTVGDLLRRGADRAPDRVALKARTPDRSDQREWTYQEVLDQSEAIARFLLRRFQPGERVTVLAPNVPEWWLLEFGAAMAGVVVVAANPASKLPELRHVLADSDSSGIVSMSEYRGADTRSMVAKVVSELPFVRETVFLNDLPGLVAAHRGDDPALPSVDADDLFMIQYTSGTTGPPKGAMMRHRGVVNTSKFATERFALDEGSVWLNCMPMCHTGGSVHSTLGTLWNLGTMLMVPQFDAGFALELIETERANWITTVPTMALRLLDHPSFPSRSMESLRLHACGGAPVAPELVDRVEREMGCDFVMIYGQTEMSGMICQTFRDDTLEHLTQSVGYPLGPINVRICAPEAPEPLAIDEVGEICYKGFSVFAGYWNNPTATEEVLSADGWFRTGDLGTIREDGYLTINGRLKDMLIRGGENIYPREIEDQLIEHPDVAEVAVIGLPDPEWGEEVAAVVRLHEGRVVDQAQLRAFLVDRISAHKVPRQWFFLDAFPVTLSGKIQKFALRESLMRQDAE
ncbi:AMP-dependent synthetase [Nocardioides immobilis]|uniref:AMP-dependent synthetase n=1 Tax=Nocardioides immobilis TaxID=2049295 RepID=A0A417Y0S6_9ACTN|nr:AMP-binding protein [Nocardioides immobilis]RHW26233.1 AMP-dependent synthetase [Nocardioides immobilis]